MKFRVEVDEKTGKPKPVEEAPREKRKPGRPKASGTSSAGGTKLEKDLQSLYEFGAGILVFADPVAAEWTHGKAAPMASAQAAWARQNEHVRRFLTGATSGGVAMGAIGVTAVWAVGLYLILISRTQPLTPQMRQAAMMLGVPVYEPGQYEHLKGRATGNGNAAGEGAPTTAERPPEGPPGFGSPSA